MKKNVGGIDRILRITLGIALLIFAFVGPEGVNKLGFIGLIPLATGLMNFCPLYPIFGFSTCKLKQQ
jgi:hypothetical protein